MKEKVLMIGPGKGKPGGILALIESLVPVLEKELPHFLYFPTVVRHTYDDTGIVTALNIRRAFSQYGRFLKTVRQFRPDIIHLHTSEGTGWLKDSVYVLVGKLLGARLIIHIHAADYDQLYTNLPAPLRVYTRRVLRRADAIIAVSSAWKERLATLAASDRIHTFRPCLTVNQFGSTAAEGNGRVHALFMGTVGQRKGAFDLLEAMGQVPPDAGLDVTIAGGEERVGDLAQASKRLQELNLQNRCHLSGIVKDEAKSRLFSQSQVFVLPSYNEGLPFAIIEAMAAGMAIVATPVGGIPEVVKDGYNGFLVSPGDVPALAERLNELATDAELRTLMGRRSRQISEQELDIAPYARRLLELYRSLI